MRALRPVVITTARSETVGVLFFKTPTHVVLLNHVVKGTNLGRVKHVVRHHGSHEADITIIPRSEVEAIQFAERAD